MKYIQKAALAAALLLLLPAAYPAHGASDTLEAAEKAAERTAISTGKPWVMWFWEKS